MAHRNSSIRLDGQSRYLCACFDTPSCGSGCGLVTTLALSKRDQFKDPAALFVRNLPGVLTYSLIVICLFYQPELRAIRLAVRRMRLPVTSSHLHFYGAMKPRRDQLPRPLEPNAIDCLHQRDAQILAHSRALDRSRLERAAPPTISAQDEASEHGPTMRIGDRQIPTSPRESR
jgi:hypothetical protein